MNGGLSRPFIKFPIATSLIMVGILFVGLVAYENLPVAPLPKVDFPTIQVSALLPGASPETMASSVAQPLERQFAQIPGVTQTTSSSGLGTTTVVVQFDLERNIDAAANDIQSAINAASGQLPRDLPSPPTYRKVNPADSPILLLSATSDALPLTGVDDNADTRLAQRMLMALTISVGFVVDDAIVMLENIVRHVEEGMKPYEAALQGAGEIAFTILSISISLIAVFIPLLLLGGIIGRLFREFAVTTTMCIAVSAFVALTLTPMMASRFLLSEREMSRGPLYAITERGFATMLLGYERALDVVLRHQFVTLCVFLATVALTVYLFVLIPKGFFPQQDTGLITGISEAGQDVSFAEMMRRQEALG